MSDTSKSAAEMVTLRTGVKVPITKVNEVMALMQDLLPADGVGFFEAVQLSCSARYDVWGDYRDKLTAHGLLQDGKMDDVTRQIIYAATRGDAWGMVIENPVARR